MVTDKFRSQLRQEAAQWQTEELIEEQFYDQLATRYEFDKLESSARNRFTMILLSIGGLLLGLGILTFVAANWQGWGREVRLILLLSVFIAVNAIGFHLWQRGRNPWQSLLGQALLFTGALSLGANMALMAQMFQIGGAEYKLFLVWGVGVLIMAYSLRLTLLGMLAIALIGIGYWAGLYQSLYEFTNYDTSLWRWVISLMPLIATVAYLPLAYWCRSRWIFVSSIIAVISSLLSLIDSSGWFFYWNNSPHQSIWGLISLILPPALLWSYDDFPWRRSSEEPEIFAAIARKLSLLLIINSCFFLSFYAAWTWSSSGNFRNYSYDIWIILLSVILFTIWTVAQWIKHSKLSLQPPYFQLDLTSTFVLSLLGIMSITTIWHNHVSLIPILGTFIFNCLLFILGIGLTREGLTGNDRLSFWLGMGLLTAQIFSRTFEYDTGLLLKSLILILCGAGVMIAGIWFERHLRHQGLVSVSNRPPT